ncbi:insulinase family protein [Luteolibacter pohnpeiensis]|uniref:Insulinase family protein n=1 Tax=Luteolibacter pohnpeiensis TaxID=454153 RepID=A0A934VTB0_9BACT|nr:pitrilysin family protein [Luteolibacter pohnpeiensis]MBK1881302.1 insulinase family protein [Luteolibacter pohnpeiensis]
MNKATYEWRQIPGGPKLAVATVPDSECAALSIYIPAGSRDEANLPTGLAHFVEHMVFKGTTRRSAKEISFEIENGGGQLNACTTEDHTVYEGRGEADLMPVLVDVLSDMVWNATFPEHEITLEREVIGEEITMYRESPSDHIGDLISSALWPDHPLGNPISGSLESIAQIDRSTLLGFRDQHYFREDIVIAAAGPFSIDEISAMFEPFLPEKFHAVEAPLAFHRNGQIPGRVTDARETDQLQLAMAWHTPGLQSPKRHALRMLSLMLGETASSRLFLELREERGLCYQIGSDVSFFDETGAFEISAGLDPESREEAIDCILREIDDLLENGPRPGELDRAKRLSISQSKQAFESTSSHAAWAGEGLMDFGRIPAPLEWRESVLAVTDEEVHAVAREIFLNQKPAIAEILPNEDE